MKPEQNIFPDLIHPAKEIHTTFKGKCCIGSAGTDEKA